MNTMEGPGSLVKGEAAYKKFLDETVRHSQGFFILAPSGAGKTHFVTHQKEKNWIDGDRLWIATGAHPDIDWWTKGIDVIKKIDAQSDAVTEKAKKLGLWILGASNSWLKPDAVVLPPWNVNIAYIKNRQETDYDGGLTTDQLDQLKNHRQEIETMAHDKSVPIFASVEEATSFIEAIYQKSK